MQIDDYGNFTRLFRFSDYGPYYILATLEDHVTLNQLLETYEQFDEVEYLRHGVKIGWHARYGEKWISGMGVPK